MSKQVQKSSGAVKKKPSAKVAAASALDKLGELPRSYGTDSIFLIAQEPRRLFTYWDIDIARHPGGRTFLRVFGPGGAVESETEVPFETRNWYIPVNEASAEYSVEIGYYRGEQWNGIARSLTIRTPQDKMSESGEFDYATIPLHLSFQKLMANIQTTMREGEPLIQALGRLQRDGRLHALGSQDGISPDERVVLEMLLGKEFLEEILVGGLGSEELSSRIQQRFSELLHSQGAGELLPKAPWGPLESSIFSALTAIVGSSPWASGAISSWAAAALTSSWPGKGELSSFTQSSWGVAALLSWLQAATTSWAGASELSSWNHAAMSSQSAVSSWGHAETSGGSENLGSFGFARRGFFLHVNAEVIFYGGTHPQAKVTIDGKPVAIGPDGTFRHHFVFPDGNYEIPIVATSPDRVETRSATLKFERATSRAGDVGHTAQPPLAAPMGARL